MHTILRHIAVMILLVAYATASQAVLLQFSSFTSGSTGGRTLDKGADHGKAGRQAHWAQRRHLPMVSPLDLSPAEPPHIFVPENPGGFLNRSQNPVSPILLLDYFSSRCNKAPPHS